MTYKVYISTANDPTGHAYARTVKQALWSISELGFIGVEREQQAQGGATHRWQTAQQIIRESDIFIGVYSDYLGTQIADTQQSTLEREYEYAKSMGKPCLIFVEHEAYPQATDHQKAFLTSVMKQQIVQHFRTNDELAALVKVAIAKHKMVKPFRPTDPSLPPPPALNFRGSSETTDETIPEDDAEFEQLIDRALFFAQDDIEVIMRRVLELYNAGNRIEATDVDGKVTASPIWGEPLRQSQFESDIFMVMPFSGAYDSVYNDVVRPLAAEQNMTVKRGDEFASVQGSIMNEVWAAIYNCKLVIAETTEPNPNVYYELGIAHTLGKPTIMLNKLENPQDVPFDIRHLRFIRYEDSIDGANDLRENLKETMIWLLNDMGEQE